MENKKKIIGMLVAVEIEAVLQRYGERLEDVSESGYSIKRLEADDYIMYILKSGAGDMENNNEKRMAGCWEILHALHIGDKEVVVGENLTEPNEARYMCPYCTANDIMRGYDECMASDDYLEIMGPMRRAYAF